MSEISRLFDKSLEFQYIIERLCANLVNLNMMKSKLNNYLEELKKYKAEKYNCPVR